jgi:hypothetical protein
MEINEFSKEELMRLQYLETAALMPKSIEELLPESEYRYWLMAESPEVKLVLTQMEARLIGLEDKVGGKKGKVFPDLPQKMLILHKLGIMEVINTLDIQEQQKAEILSLLLGEDRDNIEKMLLNYNDENDRLRKKKTYEYVYKKFNDLGLNALSEEVKEVCKKINDEL